MKIDFNRRRMAVGALFTAVALIAVFSLGACSLDALTGAEKKAEGKGPTMILNTEKGRKEVVVDIVDTMDERTRGLMYRKSLQSEAGMFFIFEGEEERSFWMKNTLIPLDMIFMDAGYKVVSIAKNAQPCKADPCPGYGSVKPAKFVLEVNGGYSDSIGLKEGDKAELKI